jgi:hypothetical protein
MGVTTGHIDTSGQQRVEILCLKVGTSGINTSAGTINAAGIEVIWQYSSRPFNDITTATITSEITGFIVKWRCRACRKSHRYKQKRKD